MPLASDAGSVSLSRMRFHLFATGLLILIAGIIGPFFLPKMPGFEFLRGGLTLGGALLICGFFTLQSYWHGIVAAGIVSLIGAGKGILEIKSLFDWFTGVRPRGIAPFIELGITIACAILVLRIVSALKIERTRRLLAAEAAAEASAER